VCILLRVRYAIRPGRVQMATEHQSLVQRAREQWEARREELRPVVDEFNEIEDALRRLDGDDSTTAQEQPAATQEQSSGQTRRRRRSRNGTSRSDEFLTLVRENPGITVADAATQMGIQPNYLYRIAGKLHQEKTIQKEGTGYKVAA
jgi:hypothetical protein